MYKFYSKFRGLVYDFFLLQIAKKKFFKHQISQNKCSTFCKPWKLNAVLPVFHQVLNYIINTHGNLINFNYKIVKISTLLTIASKLGHLIVISLLFSCYTEIQSMYRSNYKLRQDLNLRMDLIAITSFNKALILNKFNFRQVINLRQLLIIGYIFDLRQVFNLRQDFNLRKVFNLRQDFNLRKDFSLSQGSNMRQIFNLSQDS